MRGLAWGPILLSTCALAGCGQGESRPQAGRPAEVRVDVLADTGRGQVLHVAVPSPRPVVWLTKVSPSRPAFHEPLPVPSPETIEAELDPPPLAVDEGLKPPLLRHAGTLRVPRGADGWVDLDVRVTEEGDVSDALWAGGTQDSALVRAAIACALEMRFFPALQSGNPVAVWCRQHFRFDRR